MSEFSLIKLQALRTATLLKRDYNRFFSCIILQKFLRTPYFTEHLQWLLLTILGFQPAALLKKWLRETCFSVNFANFLKTSFDRTPPDDCFPYLSVSFEKFFRTLLLQSTSGKLFISCTSCRISTTRYCKKLFHRWFSSILYTNEMKPFEGVHLLKIPESYLWRS